MESSESFQTRFAYWNWSDRISWLYQMIATPECRLLRTSFTRKAGSVRGCGVNGRCFWYPGRTKGFGSPLEKGGTRERKQGLLILLLESSVSPYELVGGARLLFHRLNPNGEDLFIFLCDRVHPLGNQSIWSTTEKLLKIAQTRSFSFKSIRRPLSLVTIEHSSVPSGIRTTISVVTAPLRI